MYKIGFTQKEPHFVDFCLFPLISDLGENCSSLQKDLNSWVHFGITSYVISCLQFHWLCMRQIGRGYNLPTLPLPIFSDSWALDNKISSFVFYHGNTSLQQYNFKTFVPYNDNNFYTFCCFWRRNYVTPFQYFSLFASFSRAPFWGMRKNVWLSMRHLFVIFILTIMCDFLC